MDLSTRKLRYFVAVAEELNFSRAAARLFVAQQAISKQVRELEDAVGARLLSRTTRSVELTAPGAVMLEVARATLNALDAGVRTVVRRAACGSATGKPRRSWRSSSRSPAKRPETTTTGCRSSTHSTS